MPFFRVGRSNDVTLAFSVNMANLSEAGKDTCRWAAWVGRHTFEKISKVPQGQLNRNRNPVVSVRAQAGLMVFWTTRNAETKVWPRDPYAEVGS